MSHEFESVSKTGTPNLPSLPPTWEWIPLKYLCEVCAEYGLNIGSNEYQNEGTRFIRATDIQDFETISDEGVYLDPSICKEYVLKKGDILITRSGTVGKSYFHGLSEESCAFASYLVRFRLRNSIQPKFVAYYLESKSFNQLVELESTQVTISNVSGSKFADMPVPIPESVYQKKVVQFLDFQTYKINTLMKVNQQLLELLEEKRKALVHEAIQEENTRNLRLGFVADLVSRPIDREDDELYTQIGVYNRGRGIFHKELTQGSNLGDSDFFWVKPGDLVISGQFAWEGAVALATNEDNDCIATHRYPILRGKADSLETDYLWAFLTTKTGDFLLNEHSRGAAGRNRPLNTRTLLKEKIPVPPMDAQLRVSEHVFLERGFNRNVADSVEILNEYRQALITNAVTGQIDVTDWEPTAEEEVPV